jgi:hypothetical protein
MGCAVESGVPGGMTWINSLVLTKKAEPNQPGRWKDRFVQRVVCYYKGS